MAVDKTLRYKVTWTDGKIEFLLLTPDQAQNLKDTQLVESVELEDG